MIRGTIALHKLSKSLGFKLYVDLQLHSISNFIQVESHPYSDLIRQNKENICFVQNSDVYINNSQEDVLYFFTNDGFDITEVDPDTKDFIKRHLIPNDTFQTYLNEKFSLLPTSQYNIIHYRLGDNEIVYNGTPDYRPQLNHIKHHLEPNDILISDSFKFKQLVRATENVFVFDTNPKHLGFCSNSDELKDTMVEFYLLTRAGKIKTYSVHYWISGFVFWIAKTYDIPLINMK